MIARQQSESEITQLVESFLDSIPKGRGIAIEGHGMFSVEQLRDEVRRETPAGKEIKITVLRYNRYKRLRKRRRVREGAVAASQDG